MPEHFDLLTRLALALGIGLIVGIERGWHSRDDVPGTRVAGVRTFALIALLGGLLGAGGQFAGDLVLAAGLFGFIALVAVGYVYQTARTQEHGLTTEIAAIVTFVLGVIAVRGSMAIAAGAGVAMVMLLDMKGRLHGWIARVEGEELRAGLKLLLMSVLVLPHLPDEGFGPGGALNPYRTWWVVVVIAGLSFAAYAAIRLAGPRAGAAVTGLLGGMASSTAVTLNCARLALQVPQLTGPLAGAIALATAVMFMRALIMTFVLFTPAGTLLMAPFVAASLVAAGVGAYFFRSSRNQSADVRPARIDLGPPADIESAIKFGALLTVVALAAHYAKEFFGTAGLLATAAISGLVDIDAVTVTMTGLGNAGIEPASAVALAIVITVSVNSAAKAAYVLLIARAVLMREAAAIFGLPLAAAAAAYGVISQF